MTDEEQKIEPLVEAHPSKRELTSYYSLAANSRGLALVHCLFEGKDRYALVHVQQTKDSTQVTPLAIMLNEKDVVLLRGKDGELAPTEESKINVN